MSALDFILQTHRPGSPSGGGPAPAGASGGPGPVAEPFDQVMSRALSAPGTGGSAAFGGPVQTSPISASQPSYRSERPTPTGLDPTRAQGPSKTGVPEQSQPRSPHGGKATAISSSLPGGGCTASFLKNPTAGRSVNLVPSPKQSRPAAPRSGTASGSVPENSPSIRQMKVGAAGNDLGDDSPAVTSLKTPAEVSGDTTANLAQFVTVLLPGVPLLSLPMANKKCGPGAEAASTLPSSTATPAGSDATGVPASRPGPTPGAPVRTTVANQESVPEPATGNWIAGLTPDGRQTPAVKSTEPADGRAGREEVRHGGAPENAPAKTDSSGTNPAASDAGAKSPVLLTSLPAASAADVSMGATDPAAPETDGTFVANMAVSMNKADKMNKVAGSDAKAEKVLPGGDALPGTGMNSPMAESSPRLSSQVEQILVTGAPTAQSTGPVAATTTTAVAAMPVIDLGSRALERTHDMVALHALRLLDSNQDSLRVVIKPGAGLQMSLEMRQHGDAIDARMTLQRGDFSPLSRHWPELQQRLEQRGIRLATPTGGDNSAADRGAGGFHQSPREYTPSDPEAATAFAAFTLAGPVSTPPAPALAAAVPRHGWETWA